MKFIHAADIHLDSPLMGLGRDGKVPDHVIRDCTRRAFANLIDLAIAEDVAFVLIAGDLYDGDWKDFSTGLYFAREMQRLGRPCILVLGNHDAASVITRRLVSPPNVKVLSSRHPETVRLDTVNVAIHGQSFPNRAVPEDLSAAYPAPIPGWFNIGLLHTSGEDPGEHQTYAPCRIDALTVRGYDYWALGHIHARQQLSQQPWIVFPGNTQGRHARETGAKGCALVEVLDNRITRVEHRSTDVLRWSHVETDATGTETVAEIAALLRFDLAQALEGAEGRPMIARVTLKGTTACHAALIAEPEAIDAECRNAAAAVSGELHIERVRIDTRPAATSLVGEAIGDLEQAFQAAFDDPELQRRVLDDIGAMRALIPRTHDGAAPELPQTVEELRALVPDAWQAVAHLLSRRGAA